MRISVIIPTYNHGQYIRKALESVIHQTHPADEIIVVDDASKDQSIEVIGDFHQVKLITNQSNYGPSYCRNKAVLASSGDMISFLDADDTWPINKLEWQYKYLQDHPDVEIIAGYGKYDFDEDVEQNDQRRVFLIREPHLMPT
jgi:teichuronic acid biosynthesis glycosyltransferase TuaG